MPNEGGIPNPAGLRLTTAAPVKVVYPDYKATDDFVSWLSGFSTRVASAHGLQPENRDGLKRELLRLIPGKLALGPRPLARTFARSLAPLTHSLAPH